MIGCAFVLISKTDFWPKSGHSALDRAPVVGWISKKKKKGRHLFLVIFGNLAVKPAESDKKNVVTFFFFWRSTQPQGGDLKLNVPTLARNLFSRIHQGNDQDVLHLSLL